MACRYNFIFWIFSNSTTINFLESLYRRIFSLLLWYRTFFLVRSCFVKIFIQLLQWLVCLYTHYVFCFYRFVYDEKKYPRFSIWFYSVYYFKYLYFIELVVL